MQFTATSVEGLAEAMRAVQDVAKKHVPFVASVMINRTLEDVLAGARTQVAQRLVVRVPRFVLPPVQLPVAARATRAKLQGQAAFGYPDVTSDSIGARREKILRKFETGGEKRAIDPDVPIAIPTKALRPSPGVLVPRAMYPVNLRLAPRRDVGGGMVAAQRRGQVRSLTGDRLGKRARREQGLEGVGGTFVMFGASGRPIGIFQRTGRGRRDVRLLWAYRWRIRIPDRLDFFPLADAIVRDRALVNWEGALALALRTAR